MATPKSITSVPIRPEVAMYGVLRNLNYKSWYALAEFVDNAVQSSVEHRKELQPLHRYKYKLKVDIELNADARRIIVRDNAAGIAGKDFPRAFKPAQLPSDRQGLSEFGMGMKSAACWFANSWTVRTCALGEGVERSVSFDIRTIVEEGIEELAVRSRALSPTDHFTEISLADVHQFPVKRTIGKIKDHLTSMYRLFIRAGLLELRLDGELLAYEDPPVLKAPYYKKPKEGPVSWKKEISFSLPGGRKVEGFAALREKGSTTYAGFALFRRGRLIVGSADEPYRPQEIFGNSNSFTYQRLFGELKLDGFDVSHTKDGFQWEGVEEEFLSNLKRELNTAPVKLLDQAEEFRVNPPKVKLEQSASQAIDRTAVVVERHVPEVVERQLAQIPAEKAAPSELPDFSSRISSREQILKLNGQNWRIRIESIADISVGDWLSYSKLEASNKIDAPREISIRINLAHPFVDRFVGANQENVEVLLRVGVGLALALVAAQDIGMGKGNSVILSNFNALLRDALSMAE